MATCRICHSSIGLLSGSAEPFTGQGLYVCNGCEEILEGFNKAVKDNNIEEGDNFAHILINIAQDSEVSKILKEYCEKTMPETEAAKAERERIALAIVKEERERAQRKQKLMAGRSIQYEKNAYYEYCIETVTDSKMSGSFNKTDAQNILAEYALEGWRLHTAFTNELGKNALAIMGFAVNSTVDETIFIFERRIKAEEN